MKRSASSRPASGWTWLIGVLLGAFIMIMIIHLKEPVPCDECGGVGFIRNRSERTGWAGTTAGVPCAGCQGAGTRRRIWSILEGDG